MTKDKIGVFQELESGKLYPSFEFATELLKKNQGKTLAFFRRSKNLSQNALSKKAAVTSSCISQLEANLRCYSLDSLLRISYALGVTPNELLEIKPEVNENAFLNQYNKLNTRDQEIIFNLMEMMEKT